MATPKVKIKQISKKKFYLTFWKDGKRIKRQTFLGTKREAELIAFQYQMDMLSGAHDILREKQIISLPDLINEFLKYKKSHIRYTTYHRYENYLNPFKGFISSFFSEASKDISLIKPAYIYEAFDYFKDEKKWEPKTLNGARGCISAIFRYAIEEKYVTENPLRKLRKYKLEHKGEVKYYTEEQLELIWENLDPCWRDPLQFIYLTGLRKAEMINLTWDDVKLDKNPRISIGSKDDWKTKTGASRTIPLNQKAQKIINRWKGKHTKYVFPGPNGNKMHPDRPYHAMKKALNKMGIDGTVHMLRHTFAAKLVMSGKSLYTVGKLLGHADTKTTEIYAHLAPDYMKDVVEVL